MAAKRVVVLALMLLSMAGVASAQVHVPKIGPFAVDVRGIRAAYGPTPEQAALIGYADTDLPGHGYGVDVGAHWYPLKWWVITFGVGGNALLSKGHSAPEDAKTGKPTGNEADTRFRAMASQVSLNFGTGEGWSYLSGGLGYSTFAISNATHPEASSLPRRKTINFGGGARWEVRRHVAFSLDLRFYKIAAQDGGESVSGGGATTRVVIGAGVALK